MALKQQRWNGQQGKQRWRSIGLAIFCLLWFPDVSFNAQAESIKKPSPAPAQKPKPSNAQWQPNELQRAMVLGTTTPNERPIMPPSSDYSDSGYPEMMEDSSSPPAETLPIFRKPIPISSPAKPRQQPINSSPTPR